MIPGGPEFDVNVLARLGTMVASAGILGTVVHFLTRRPK